MSFPFSNRVIDRSLSAMNGCKREGGKNPELQVTDHGSDTACMQTGRGRGERKNCIASERKKKKREINHTLKNKNKKVDDKQARRIFVSTTGEPQKTMRRKLDVYCRRNEVYRALLDSAIAN